MAPETAKPTPQDLATLESAFAADPTGDSYKPLAEAYLSLGRFMEAMVVCKKGVKAHPEDASARVLLARVYAEQGKDRKAQEELRGALEVDAEHAAANRLIGILLLNQGEMDDGAEHLKRSADADPSDAETLAAIEKWGIEYTPAGAAEPEPEPEAPPPPPPPDMSPPEVVASSAPPPPAPNGPMAAAPAAPAPPPSAVPPSVVVDAGPGAPTTNAPPVMTPSAPAVGPAGPTPRPPPPRPAPSRPAPPAAPPAPDAHVDYTIFDQTPPKKSSKAGLIGTVGLLAFGLIAVAGYWFYATANAEKAREIDKLLKRAQEQLSQDSYASYRGASQTIGEILELDPDQFAAHAYLGYISVLRWGEHGEGDTYKQQAEEHIARAAEEGREHSHLIAAQAYRKYFTGDPQGALAQLKEVLGREDVTSSLLAGALGTMLMWSGDLDEANRMLLKANQFAAGDPRILATLGELQRRRGNDGRAWKFYDQALRFDPNHVDSLLGHSLIILENDRMDPAKAEAIISKLEGMDNEVVSPKQRAMTHFAKAQYLYSQNKKGDAKEEEDKALILQPNNPDIHVMIGRRFFREENYSAAGDAVRKAIEIEPKRAGFYVELARILLTSRDGAKEAVTALETARRTIPDDPKILVLLGDAHAKNKDVSAALTAYKQAISMEEGDYPQAQLAIGRMYRERREYDKAIPELEKALAQYKKAISPRGQAESSLELARIWTAKGDGEKSKTLLEQALKSDPTFADSYYFLGRHLSGDKKQKDQAKTALEAYLKLAPSGEFAEEASSLLKRI